nr:MAG: extracellular solute-binding protein [Hyphomicrobiales bacterium]
MTGWAAWVIYSAAGSKMAGKTLLLRTANRQIRWIARKTRSVLCSAVLEAGNLRRWILRALAGAGVLVAGAAGGLATLLMYPSLLARENLTVVSWGDAYQQAQTIAFFHPFSDRTGIDLDGTIYGGGIGEIISQVESGEVLWDVVDFDLGDAVTACREGLLETIDPSMLPAGANGENAENDFVPGALGPCWAGTVVYSQIIAYAPSRTNAPPNSAADFFDLENFPGMRALRDAGPEYNLPLALFADGAGPSEIYPLLKTEQGIARAFAKLETIKDSVLWWRRPNEPIEMLAGGEIIMTTALNGRAFDAQNANADIATLWDGQVYGLDVFGIPKGTPARERAIEFVIFASSPAPLAEISSRLPYGPARLSASALVGPNPITGQTMREHLPTAPENFQNALLIDPEWWAENGAPLRARWDAWRAE